MSDETALLIAGAALLVLWIQSQRVHTPGDNVKRLVDDGLATLKEAVEPIYRGFESAPPSMQPTSSIYGSSGTCAGCGGH